MDQGSGEISPGLLGQRFQLAYFGLLLNLFIALLSAVNCKKKEPDTKRKEGGVSAKPPTPKAEAEKEPKKSNQESTPKKGEKQEDTFEEHVPKKEEAKRAKDIKDAKAFNAGDYKTWNKLMKEDDDFEKPIADRAGGEKAAGDKAADEAAKGANEANKTKTSLEKGAEAAKEKSEKGTEKLAPDAAKSNVEQNKDGEEKDAKKDGG